MASKVVSADSQELSSMVVDAVLAVAEKSAGDDEHRYKVDIDNIKMEKKAGGSISDTKIHPRNCT